MAYMEFYMHDTFEDDWYYCPNCVKNDVARSFKFCPQCGVRIHWSDEE